MFICCPKRAGKTTVMLALYLEYIEKNFDIVVVLCGNPHCASQYKGIIPAKYVHDRYKQQVLKDFFQKSDNIIRKRGKKYLPKTFIILDDCLRMRKTAEQCRTMDDPYIHRLFTEHRHYNCGVALCVQNIACGAGSWIRNSDVFLTTPSSLSNGADFDLVGKQYMGSAKGAETNFLIMNTFKKHEFLVIRYHPASRNPDDMLRRYKVRREMVRYIKREELLYETE
jgi:hypothetical protein